MVQTTSANSSKCASSKALNDTVISNGYCIGCGVCAIPDNSPFRIEMSEFGQYKARLDEQRIPTPASTAYDELCPFGSNSLNENEIGSELFKDNCSYDKNLGYYKGTYAGYVGEGTFRNKGSSGGMGTWILYELLRKGLVDYIINVKPEGDKHGTDTPLFSFTVSNTAESMMNGAKSRYYPVELSKVLEHVQKTPGRYAIVGLPCFIKSVRLLQRQNRILAERIQYCIGLVCGHLKSTRYSQSLAWQAGIEPNTLDSIDFRVKDPSAPANRYRTSFSNKNIDTEVPTNDLFGTDWGAGAFKYKACDFCDDVFAETADVVLGDAWLSQYVEDSAGTNILVTRNGDIHDLVSSARAEGRLLLDDLSLEDTSASQGGGLRHRQGAIGYRLFVEKEKGHWVPPKRFSPLETSCSLYDRKRQDFRTNLRDLSHSSFQKAIENNDLSVYLDAMRPVLNDYLSVKESLLKRIVSFAKRVKNKSQKQLKKFGLVKH